MSKECAGVTIANEDAIANAAAPTTATASEPPTSTANSNPGSTLTITPITTSDAVIDLITTSAVAAPPIALEVTVAQDHKEETWDKVLSVDTATLQRVETFLNNLRQLFRTCSRDVVEVVAQKRELENLIESLQLEESPDISKLQVLKADAEQLAQQVRLYDDLTSRAAQRSFAFVQQASPNSTMSSDSSPSASNRSPMSLRRVQSQSLENMFSPPETPTAGYNAREREAEARHQEAREAREAKELADLSHELHDFSPPASPLFSNELTPKDYTPLQDAYYSASTYVCAFREILYDAQKRKLESKRVCEGFLNVESILLAELCLHVAILPPQGQSSVVSIFKYLFENYKDGSTAYMLTRPGLLTLLIDGYAGGFCGHATGSILRQCARQSVLCDLIHKSSSFSNFFDYVQISTFELASDAFSTFGLCLTRHPPICAKFLLANFDFILIEKWSRLLLSRTYVTQRQALTILRQILNNRAFFHVMIKYVSNKKCLDNIVYLMTARKIKEGIRLDAFHVLKIYVQNPRKTPEILQVLTDQASKLLKGLEELTPTKEMEVVQDMLEKLVPPSRSA